MDFKKLNLKKIIGGSIFGISLAVIVFYIIYEAIFIERYADSGLVENLTKKDIKKQLKDLKEEKKKAKGSEKKTIRNRIKELRKLKKTKKNKNSKSKMSRKKAKKELKKLRKKKKNAKDSESKSVIKDRMDDLRKLLGKKIDKSETSKKDAKKELKKLRKEKKKAKGVKKRKILGKDKKDDTVMQDIVIPPNTNSELDPFTDSDSDVEYDDYQYDSYSSDSDSDSDSDEIQELKDQLNRYEGKYNQMISEARDIIDQQKNMLEDCGNHKSDKCKKDCETKCSNPCGNAQNTPGWDASDLKPNPNIDSQYGYVYVPNKYWNMWNNQRNVSTDNHPNLSTDQNCKVYPHIANGFPLDSLTLENK